MFVAGVDGCRVGWVLFRIDVPTLSTAIEIVDLPGLLTNRPERLASLGIDIPIGLLDCPRQCDQTARRLLGRPRGSSMFPSPCRAAVQALTYQEACETNHARTGRKLSQQVWGIAAKIRQVDNVMTPDCQRWAFEVHPEVCFWALNGGVAVANSTKDHGGPKRKTEPAAQGIPRIESHLAKRPGGVGADDLLDAAAAAWTALRWSRGEARPVCTPAVDDRALLATIWY